MNFNREVDDALPLDDVIIPNPQLRKLLEDIDKTKVKLWLFTNAYMTHAERVVRLLGVDDLFEGITYCDYSKMPLVCKPHVEMYEKAEAEAGAASSEECYFVGRSSIEHLNQAISQWIDWLTGDRSPDDSHLNCRHAHARGWTTAHLIEQEDPEPATKAAKFQIRNLEELRQVFPEFFKDHGSMVGDGKPQQLNPSPQL